MERIIFMLLTALCATIALAQVPTRDYNRYPPDNSYEYYKQDDWEQRKRFNSHNDYEYDYVTNISAGWQRLTFACDEETDIISNFGCFVQVTTTYKLMDLNDDFSIGFDASWLELNYANYKPRLHNYGIVEEKTYHQGEIGVQAGLSATLTPTDEFSSTIYIRYAPSFDMLHRDKTLYGGYGNYLVAGLSLYYGQFGIGGDFRYGNCTYSRLGSNKDDNLTEELPKSSSIGFRCYFTFKF